MGAAGTDAALRDDSKDFFKEVAHREVVPVLLDDVVMCFVPSSRWVYL